MCEKSESPSGPSLGWKILTMASHEVAAFAWLRRLRNPTSGSSKNNRRRDERLRLTREHLDCALELEVTSLDHGRPGQIERSRGSAAQARTSAGAYQAVG